MTEPPPRRTLAPVGRRRVEVLDRRTLGAYVLLRCADPGGPAPRPGQFYMLAAAERWGGGDGGRPFLSRAFSFLRHDRDRGELEFLLEDVGPGTHRLGELAEGDGVWLVGPLGLGYGAPQPATRPLLVGGGIGIVPLAGLLDELRAGGADPFVLLGFRGADHAPAAELFGGATVSTDDGSVGRRGLVTDALAEALSAGPHSVYACGPAPMLEAVRAACLARDTAAQLALEAPMACGYGACFGCVVACHGGYRRVCLDGPVFDAAELVEGALLEGAHACASPQPAARAAIGLT